MKLNDELKLLQDKWTKSKARNVLEPIPDGRYTVKIVDNRLERAKSSGRLQVVTVMQITKGKFKGRMAYKYSGLESENNISFLKADLKQIGITVPKKIVNITSSLEETLDKVIEIEIKTKGEFTNTYFRSIAEDQEPEEDNGNTDVDDDDDEEE